MADTPPQADTPPAEKETFTRFTFDNDFFELEGAPSSARPKPADPSAPPKKQLTGAEPRTLKNIKDALDQGYAEGFAAAQTQAEANYATELENLKKANQAAIQAIQQAVAETEAHLTRSALTLLRGSLHHLVGHAAENYPDQVLETHLKELVRHISTHEELTLRIAPAARAFHEKLGLSHANIQGIGFHIKEDGGLQPTDCVAEWRRGGVEVKLSEHLARLDTLLIGAGADSGPIPAPIKSAKSQTQEQPSPPAEPNPQTESEPVTDTPPAEETATPPKEPSLADELRADNDLVDALK